MTYAVPPGTSRASMLPGAALAAVLCLPLAGCWMGPRPLPPWPLPRVADGPIRGNWVQTVRLERGGKELDLIAVIECDGAVLTLAGLTPAGQRLAIITWSDGGIRQEADPNLPARFDGEGILRDLALAYWPAEALRKTLAGTDWSLDSGTGGRRVLSGRGTPRIEISVDPADGDGALTVRHLREGYVVRVATVERTEP